MKIVSKYFPDEKNYGENERLELEMDGKELFSAGGGEPEDNCLGRDLNFCHSIADWLQQAHAAGVAGEPFELEHQTLED